MRRCALDATPKGCWSLTDAADTFLDELFHTVELSNPEFERDGLRLATVKSRALGRRTDVTFWVPSESGDVTTLLILLHGVYGSHWCWSLKGGAHRTAARLVGEGRIAPVVLAMPSDGLLHDGSGYLQWPMMDVERFVIDEVSRLARLAAPALTPDCRIAIAGLSMGGYGALRLGAKYPERFCAISAHSAITEMGDLAGFVEEPIGVYEQCAPAEEMTALYWLERNKDRLPPLRFDCGREDPLLASNRALHVALEAQGIAHGYEEFAGGHTWPYWQQHLEETLMHVDRHREGVAKR